jgi:folylpolyglutamate synthase/dihydropteroate synthase
LAYRDRGGLALEAALPLLGGHQIDNAGLAIACLRRLWNDDGGASVRRAASQLATVRLPGRVELMGQRPGRVVDGAHTAASARALAAAIAPLPGRRHWVLSISEGKDLGAILDALLQDACSVTVTRAEPRRSLDPTVLAAAVAERIPEASVRIEPDPARAVREACAGAAPTDLVVATGSVYLAGIARSAWADAPDAPAPGPPGPAVVTARGPRP